MLGERMLVLETARRGPAQAQRVFHLKPVERACLEELEIYRAPARFFYLQDTWRKWRTGLHGVKDRTGRSHQIDVQPFLIRAVFRHPKQGLAAIVELTVE